MLWTFKVLKPGKMGFIFTLTTFKARTQTIRGNVYFKDFACATKKSRYYPSYVPQK